MKYEKAALLGRFFVIFKGYVKAFVWFVICVVQAVVARAVAPCSDKKDLFCKNFCGINLFL